MQEPELLMVAKKTTKLFKKNFLLMMDAISQLYSKDCIEVTCNTFSQVLPYVTGLFSAIRIESAPPIGMKFYDDYSINNAKIVVKIRLFSTDRKPYTIEIASEWELRGAYLSYRNNAYHHGEWFLDEESQVNIMKDEKFEKLAHVFGNFVRDSARKFGEIANKSTKSLK